MGYHTEEETQGLHTWQPETRRYMITITGREDTATIPDNYRVPLVRDGNLLALPAALIQPTDLILKGERSSLNYGQELAREHIFQLEPIKKLVHH